MHNLDVTCDRPRVLAIDDDQGVLSLLCSMLNAKGCEVVQLSDPTEVANVFREGQFDLITLDYRMPDLNGLEVHRLQSERFGFGRIGAARHGRGHGWIGALPPIIVITGVPQEAAVVVLKFMESVAGTIAKPFGIEDIRQVAGIAFDHYHRRTQHHPN